MIYLEKPIEFNPNNAEIIINDYEHQTFCWATPQEAFELNLMDDSADTIRMYYQK